MKWKIRKPNVKPIPPEPNIGDTKVIKKFAWLPKKHKSYQYWLQFYHEVYEWKTFDYWERVPNERISIEDGWTLHEFINGLKVSAAVKKELNQWAIEKYGVLKKFTKTDWKLIETRF